MFSLRATGPRREGESRWEPSPLVIGVADGATAGAFLLDPFSVGSATAPEWKGTGPVRPAKEIASRARIVGVLGTDYLRDKIFGFDPAAGTVTVWPAGTERETVNAWAGKDATSVPLEILPDGRPVALVTVDAKPLRFLLGTPARGVLVRTSVLPTGAIDLAETRGIVANVPYRGLVSVTAPGRRLGWLMAGAESESRFGLADGSMPIFEGVKGRFVLDILHKRTLSTPQTADERIASEVSRAIRLGVSVTDEALVVDGYWTGQPGWESVRGRPLVKLDRWEASSVVRELRATPVGEGLKTLAFLRRSGFDITVRASESSEVTVTVPKPQ